ncbi:MAG: outer membrane lipoprotein-sorting protein [Gammaproteobacteria bacterium]|nr:outer membrane lipoprotein-sorting protein [Gammaproteobacteria bacterium]
MSRYLFTLALSCILSATSVWAATETTPGAADKPAANRGKPQENKLTPAKLTLAQIIEKHAAARGGLKAWRAVQTLTFTGKMDAGRPVKPTPPPGPNVIPPNRPARIEAAKKREAEIEAASKQVQVPYILELKRPHKSRLEIQFEGQTALQVYDGEKGWKLRPFLGRHEVEAYNDEELQLAAEQTELDGALLDYAAKGYKAQLEGMEPVEGHDAYRIKVTFKNGQARHVWVDAKSFLEVKIDESRKLGGKLRAVYTMLRDYKTVDGLKIPHLLETRVEGARSVEKIIVEHVTVNPKLDDTRFAKLQ